MLLAPFVLLACSGPVEEPLLVRGQRIVPEAGNGIRLARSETPQVAIQETEDRATPRIDLDDSMVLVTAVDGNLDFDEPEEQIVVVKRRDDPSDRIRLIIADFDALRNAYRETWRGETLATNIRTFSVNTADLLGDHQLELLAIGTDNDGQQTMNVFRRTTSPLAVTGLSYREIFSVATDGSVEVVDQPRSDAYRTRQAAGTSFPIQVFRRNEATENPLDLLRTLYAWRVEDGRYVLFSTEPIPAVEIEEARLRELYSADVDQLEAHISGPWFRARGEQLADRPELAWFDPAMREVVFHHGDTQERYRWLNSARTLYAGGPGLFINLRNDVLPTVRRQLAITMVGRDAVVMSIDGAEYWNGRYQRMTPGIGDSVVRRTDPEPLGFELHGVYRNDNDVEMLFESPAFQFRGPEREWSGGYNLMRLDVPVLELRVVEAASPPTDHRVREDGTFSAAYIVEHTVETSDDRLVRRLTLQPARLTVDGVRPEAAPPIVLEQVAETGEG